ncbi:DNA topoisomerase 1 [subsurface metagenome]
MLFLFLLSLLSFSFHIVKILNELIICEKRKAAEAIANAIGIPDKLSFNKLSYYYIKDKNIYVVPLRGHIKEYRNTDKYKSWTKTDPRDILTNPDSIFKFPSTYANNYIRLLAFISKKLNVNSCIIGTDADVEGCNIGLVDAYSVIKKSKNITKISQLWLSSLQKQDIIRAYNNQIQPKWSWAYAGEARAIIDAIIGFSATREVSLTLKSLIKKANVQFVSIGRVQTCLLYLIFLRGTQIRNFIPKPFWVINAIVENNGFKYVCPNLKNPIQEKKTAETVFNKIRNERNGYIKNINSRTILKYPPTPLNTSKALQLIIKHSNVTAIHALKILEDLYLNQLITYPRTDTDKYKESFNHTENITQFLTHADYGDFSLSIYFLSINS